MAVVLHPFETFTPSMVIALFVASGCSLSKINNASKSIVTYES